MDETTELDPRCLSADERAEVAAAWQTFQRALQPLGALIEQEQELPCNELYGAFQQLTVAFDGVERAIMRAQQIRLLNAAQGR